MPKHKKQVLPQKERSSWNVKLRKAACESVFAKEVLFEGNCEQAVDTELTLPDYCPDIGRLLKCRLVLMITSRQVNFDSLVVEGAARISVMYLDDRDKKLRCCDRDYPFRASVPYDGSTDHCGLLAAAHVDYVNCRAVSQRKLDIHGAFTVHMTAVCRRENGLVTDVEGDGHRAWRRQAACFFHLTQQCRALCRGVTDHPGKAHRQGRRRVHNDLLHRAG